MLISSYVFSDIEYYILYERRRNYTLFNQNAQIHPTELHQSTTQNTQSRENQGDKTQIPRN